MRSHGELHGFVAVLRRGTGDAELSTLWASATSLHQIFYEDWQPSETVKDWIGNVKKFVEKFKAEVTGSKVQTVYKVACV